ncbi:hypothetical protein ACI797_27470 [Geodermatophilus sp. SYSU D00691]
MRTGLQEHLGSRQVTKVVYGAIIGLALVVALEAHPPRAGAVIAYLVGTAVAVALAEVFSEVVGAETSSRRPVTRAQLGHMAEDAGSVAFGVAFPAVFFLLAALGVFGTATAFTVAKWSGLGLIGFYGYWAARFAGATRTRAVVRGASVALVGAALIALKALVH